MDQKLKQRLVGIGVIFSLAVIFLPMILDGSGHRIESLDVDIPQPPRVESNTHVQEKIIELKREAANLPKLKPTFVDETSDPREPEKKEETDKVSPESEPVKKTEPIKKQPTEAKKEITPQPKPAPKKVEKPQVGGDLWVIQAGSFRDKNKAYNHRDQLRKAKLAAVFIEKFEHDNTTSYRVRMGPFLTRDKATVVKNKVLAKYNIKGIVMKYEK